MYKDRTLFSCQYCGKDIAADGLDDMPKLRWAERNGMPDTASVEWRCPSCQNWVSEEEEYCDR